MSIASWIKDDYMKSIGYQGKNLKSFPLNRIYAFIDLKCKLPLKHTGYVYTPYMIVHNSGNVIFSSIYWRDNKPIYICLSPTFESSKGEFRDTFCEYERINDVYKHFGKIISQLEDEIIKKINDDKFKINYGVYSGNESELNLEDKDMHSIGIKLLTLSSFITIYRTIYNQIQLHTHKSYINIVNQIITIDKDFIFKYYDESKKIYNYVFRNNSERPYGQKLTPLTVGEVISVGNISYKPWRELIISYAVSDMVLNYVCPSFAIGSNWTLIEGIDETMFDNSIIRHRLKTGEFIQNMVDEYKKIYEQSSKVEDVEKYRENLLDEIQDLHKYKVISKIALAKIDENVGFTIGTIPRNIRKAKIVQPHYNNLITDINYFNKYMFDILYGCHVLHKKLGVINFDLHLNNVTIAKVDTFYKTEVDKNGIVSIKYNKDEKYVTEYVIDKDTYTFPFDGFYSCIIDFSDSLVSKPFLDYAEKFIERSNEEDIIDKEKDEIYDKLADALPYAKKNKDKVKGIIISDYKNMFKVIATMDYITFLRKLRMTFEMDMEIGKRDTDKRKLNISPDIMEQLKRMEDESLKFMLTNLQKVITKNYTDIPLPGDELIPEFFSAYKNIDNKNSKVYEAWNFNSINEGKWSVANPAFYPPWTKRDEVEKKFGKELTDEFFNGCKNIHIEDDLYNPQLNFIVESLKMDTDPVLGKFSLHTRTNLHRHRRLRRH